MSGSPPLGYLLKRTEDLFIKRMDAALREVGLTMPQFTSLHALHEHREGLSNAELARECFVTPQAMHGVLKLLESHELVMRPEVPKSGRALVARLTRNGVSSYKRAQRRADLTAEHAFSKLSAARRREFRKALEIVTETLENARDS